MAKKRKKKGFLSNPRSELGSIGGSLAAGGAGYVAVKGTSALARAFFAKYGKAWLDLPAGLAAAVLLYFVTKHRSVRRYRTEALVGAGIAAGLMLIKKFMPGLAALLGESPSLVSLPAAPRPSPSMQDRLDEQVMVNLPTQAITGGRESGVQMDDVDQPAILDEQAEDDGLGSLSPSGWAAPYGAS